jgi:hypothetical protein
MRTLTTLMSVALLAGAPTIAQAIHCPDGTTATRVPTTREVRSKPYFPVSEEFCVDDSGSQKGVREGPYVLWGPNGEALQEGHYVAGKKDGEWIYRFPSQTVARTWKDDEYVSTRVIADAPSRFVIDFEACEPHTYEIPADMGSTTYSVIGKVGSHCALIYSKDLGTGEAAQSRCDVPSSLQRVTVPNGEMGLDFSAIKEYCAPQKKIASR